MVTDVSWKRAISPIEFCCIYGGEDFDGRRWTREYLTSEASEIWEAAVCVEPPLGELKPAPMEPLKIKEIYQPVGVREVETGVWQYDLGKNFSGWARIFLKTDGSRAGQKVVLKTAEK